MKDTPGTAHALPLKLQTLLRKAGFPSWQALMQRVRAESDILPACLRSNPKESFTSGLIKGLGGTPPPDSNPRKTEQLLRGIDQLPQDDLELARFLGKAPKAEVDECGKFLDRLETLLERVEAWKRAAGFRKGIGGRPSLPLPLKTQIIQECERLSRQEHMPMQEAVQRVARAHNISSRTVWKIRREAKQLHVMASDPIAQAREPEAVQAVAAVPVPVAATGPPQNTGRKALLAASTRTPAPHRRR